MEEAAIAAGSARVAAQGTRLGTTSKGDSGVIGPQDGGMDEAPAVEMTRVQHAPSSTQQKSFPVGKGGPVEPSGGVVNPLSGGRRG